MEEKLLKIINHYGVSHQLKKLSEEIFELQEVVIMLKNEINKMNKEYPEILYPKVTSYKLHLMEELGDVNVLLNQFFVLYGLNEEYIEDFMKAKIERQLKRMENDKQ